MSWKVDYSKSAGKFLSKQPQIRDQIKGTVRNLIKSLDGEVTSIDISPLKGEWQGYYRIRKGNIRIVVEINVDECLIYVYDINFRGSIYSD